MYIKWNITHNSSILADIQRKRAEELNEEIYFATEVHAFRNFQKDTGQYVY